MESAYLKILSKKAEEHEMSLQIAKKRSHLYTLTLLAGELKKTEGDRIFKKQAS